MLDVGSHRPRVAHIGLLPRSPSLPGGRILLQAPNDLSQPYRDPDGSVLARAIQLRRGFAAEDALRARSRFVCLLQPPMVSRISSGAPDCPVWTAAIDEQLNDHGYILPAWATPAMHVRHEIVDRTLLSVRLKYGTARSCFSAAARTLRTELRRLPVFGSLSGSRAVRA